MINRNFKRKVTELVEFINENLSLEMSSIRGDVVSLSIEKDLMQDLIFLVKEIEEILETDDEEI